MSVLSEALYGVPGISTTGAGLCVRGGVDHASEVAAMDGCENLGEAYGTDALEDEVEGEVDLRVLAVHLLGGDVDAAAGGDDDIDGLIDIGSHAAGRRGDVWSPKPTRNLPLLHVKARLGLPPLYQRQRAQLTSLL
jgi:hypothetical protein